MTERRTVIVEAAGARHRIAAFSREGRLAPILFLHGFGSTKEDFADAAWRPGLAAHGLIALDALGSGRSPAPADGSVTVDLIGETALALLDAEGVRQFHLVGHSMGALAGLLLAERCAGRLLSFVNIEGNLAPEDCFFSRQAAGRDIPDPACFLDELGAAAAEDGKAGAALWAAGLAGKVDPGTVVSLFASIVRHSDEGELLARFLALRCAKLFIYGEQGGGPAYLDALAEGGVALCPIAECGHFPMYSNPPAMWNAIERFVAGADTA
jgi:pimeloyl-ACP methyl ester carboxylesterase